MAVSLGPHGTLVMGMKSLEETIYSMTVNFRHKSLKNRHKTQSVMVLKSVMD
jgi:hypothetical protein